MQQLTGKIKIVRKWLLLGIIFLSFVLRFNKLGSVPPSLQWDEVSIGYDAYSLLKTGRDQFGKPFPLFFRSLDDWKPGFYEYLATLPIVLFGLNEFSVRFPAAFIGTLTVLLTYLLVNEIFSVRRLALLSAFLLAISPWHLQISRAGFEVTISIFLLVLAVWLFLKGLRQKNRLWLASFLFGFGFFSYHSARVVFPLMWLSLLIIFRKKLFSCLSGGLSFLLPFCILGLCFLPFAFKPEINMRFKATNILEAEKFQQRSAEKILEAQKKGNPFLARIIYNRRFAFINRENVVKIAKNYLSHFNFEFLFIKADAPLHHAPGMGLQYIVLFPFIVLGAVFLLIKYLNKQTLILIIWLLISPLPASVTWGVPHAIRSALSIPIYEIFASLGFMVIYRLLAKKQKAALTGFAFLAVLLLTVNFIYYLRQYYQRLPQQWSVNWLYGRKQAVAFTQKQKKNYDKVVVSTKLEFPWVFWLFYSKYDPKKYLQEGGTKSGGFASQINSFDKYEFREFDYLNEKNGKLIFVGLESEFPKNIKTLKTIYNLDNQISLMIVK